MRRPARLDLHRPFEHFLEDRGPHLAAMIAYFALLSLVPLVFLSLALLGLVDRADEEALLVRELKAVLPAASVEGIVEVLQSIQDNAATLGIIGGLFLLWTSLSLFSVLESALNLVYRLPNRPFLRGKGLAMALMASSLLILVVGLVVGSLGYDLLKHFAPGVLGNDYVALLLSLLVSTGAVFAFLVSIYSLLPNAEIKARSVLPGALVGAVLLQVSFQSLPVYLRLTSRDEVVSLKALGAPVILLIWLYVMANIIVFGAEINRWRSGR